MEARRGLYTRQGSGGWSWDHQRTALLLSGALWLRGSTEQPCPVLRGHPAGLSQATAASPVAGHLQQWTLTPAVSGTGRPPGGPAWSQSCKSPVPGASSLALQARGVGPPVSRETFLHPPSSCPIKSPGTSVSHFPPSDCRVSASLLLSLASVSESPAPLSVSGVPLSPLLSLGWSPHWSMGSVSLFSALFHVSPLESPPLCLPRPVPGSLALCLPWVV